MPSDDEFSKGMTGDSAGPVKDDSAENHLKDKKLWLHAGIFHVISLAVDIAERRAQQEWERDGKPPPGPLFSVEYTSAALADLISNSQAMADIYAFDRAKRPEGATYPSTPLQALSGMLNTTLCGVPGTLRDGFGRALRPARLSCALSQQAICQLGTLLLLRLDKIETFISARVMILRNFPEEQKTFPLDQAECATIALYQYTEAMRAEIVEFMEPLPPENQ